MSLSGAHLPPLEESDPTKSALRRFVEESEGAASYHQKQGLVDELHAFLTQMRVGDTVATYDDNRMYLGRITGDAVQTTSPGGLSNLRRSVTWRADGHPYDELPGELRQKLSVQHDVVDLTGVLDALDGLAGEADGTDRAEAADTLERAAPKELTLPGISEAHAEELLVHDRAWLEELRELLLDEKQLVFYGPPGTGKTYLGRSSPSTSAAARSRSRSCRSTRRTPTRTSSRASVRWRTPRRGRWRSGSPPARCGSSPTSPPATATGTSRTS
ncbi:hypothetical protein SALBM217S_08817 [Streptomyces griseoloalbus]